MSFALSLSSTTSTRPRDIPNYLRGYGYDCDVSFFFSTDTVQLLFSIPQMSALLSQHRMSFILKLHSTTRIFLSNAGLFLLLDAT